MKNLKLTRLLDGEMSRSVRDSVGSMRLIDFLGSKTARQTGTLYGSQLLVTALGFVTALIVTRGLGPEDYGILSFIMAVISFVSLFFEFGFFSAGARLLALAKSEREEQELVGALTLVTIAIGLSFFLTIFALSFFIDGIFRTQVGGMLRLISPLVIVFPFQYMLQQVCQGANRVENMALQNVVPKLWYLTGLLVVVSFFRLDVLTALLLSLTGTVVTTGLILWGLRPHFGNLVNGVRVIWKETREYGFHVFLGRIADVSTYQLDQMLIPYFVNTTQLGFYSLARTLTGPMAMLPQSLSTSLFKGFANSIRISRKVLLFNFIWLSACVVGLTLLSKVVVATLFSNRFMSVVPLVFPLALAGFFRGMYQPYNMFLGAKRRGKWLRQMSFIMTAANLLGNMTLVPLWGVMGAAIASIIGALTYYMLSVIYYRRYCEGLPS